MDALFRLVAGWASGAGPDLVVMGLPELREAAPGTEPGIGLHRARRAGRRGRRAALLAAPAGPLCAGVDEAGRGPLAGPVVACAVVLPPGVAVPGLRDSKELSAARREEVLRRVLAGALDVRLAVASHRLVDRLNVLGAALHAMASAVAALDPAPDRVVVDGPLALPLDLGMEQQPVVDADARVACVAAASVVAKVMRDRLMILLDRAYPGYGFARHKGYPTREHLEALQALGPSPVHRRSFAPVARAGARPA